MLKSTGFGTLLEQQAQKLPISWSQPFLLIQFCSEDSETKTDVAKKSNGKLWLVQILGLLRSI